MAMTTKKEAEEAFLLIRHELDHIAYPPRTSGDRALMAVAELTLRNYIQIQANRSVIITLCALLILAGVVRIFV